MTTNNKNTLNLLNTHNHRTIPNMSKQPHPSDTFEDARESRLLWSASMDEKLKKKMRKDAFAACKLLVGQFAECAKGLLVFFFFSSFFVLVRLEPSWMRAGAEQANSPS